MKVNVAFIKKRRESSHKYCQLFFVYHHICLKDWSRKVNLLSSITLCFRRKCHKETRLRNIFTPLSFPTYINFLAYKTFCTHRYCLQVLTFNHSYKKRESQKTQAVKSIFAFELEIHQNCEKWLLLTRIFLVKMTLRLV